MAELKGTQVASIVVPFTDADKYATHDAEYGKGGFRSVETIALRNAIPTERKTKGMVVRVNETGLHYYWNGSAWTEWLPKGTMLVDAMFDFYSTNPVQNKVITTRINEHAAKFDDIYSKIENIPTITIDTALSTTSTNPVQNKVITAKTQAIDGSINAVSGRVTTLETWKNGIGNKNQANGVAGLDASGKISASQLPAGYDNVDKLVAFVANAPTSGMTIGQKWYITSTKKIFTATSATSGSSSTPIGNDMIYIDQNANKSYYWSGTDMVNIGSGNALALGLTHSTAFYGDFGNILYTNFGTGTNLTGTQDARDCFAKLKRDFGSAGNASVIKTLHVNTYSNNIILQDDILYFNGEQNNGDGFEIPSVTTSKAGVMTADMYKTLQEIELATFPLNLNIVPSSNSVFEKGSSYTPTINISVSRKGTNVTSESNINVVGEPTLSGSISSDKQKWIPTKAVTANQKLTVTATYGSQSASKVYYVFFKNKKYWGTSANTSLTNAQVLALEGSTWADNRLMESTNFDCTGGKYPYYVIPANVYNGLQVWVGGLKNTDITVTDMTVTNASGSSQTYKVIRLTNIQTGVLSIEFK